MDIERQKFEELKHTDRLPSPSGVGMRILVLTQEDECSIDEIAETIQADPALTGRIIKLASSAHLAGAVPISTAREAAGRLGIRAVTSVALGFSLVAGNRAGRCPGFDYDRYWSWSLANAVAAGALSREFKLGVPAEFFTCGLLARVGELALASVHPAQYEKLIALIKRDSSMDLAALEREHFNLDHRQIGAAMLEDWGLPTGFSEAIRAFRSEEGSTELDDADAGDLLRVLNLSGVIADLCVCGPDEYPLQWNRLEAIATDFGITEDELRSLFARIVPEWKEWGHLLDVATKKVPTFEELQAKSKVLGPPELSVDAGSTQRGGLRVLAVDDDPVSLRILVRHLERAGHLVITATNGNEALALALETNPQIVVTDWMMPEMDGLELCRSLRRIRTGRNLYILILTGRDEEDRVVEAFEVGVDDFVSKPFKPKLLLARIRGGERVVRLQEQVDQYISTLKQANAAKDIQQRKLKAAAMTDILTQMRNRRYAMERLKKEWAMSERSNQPFSVVMLDIDKFKSINDGYGHAAGDAVLQATAGAIGRTLRRGDTAARIGGEEFLVICPNTDSEGARRVAERIRRAIEGNEITTEGFRGSITVSLGVGTRTPSLDSFDELLRIADKAVYQAKRGGRNRTEIGHVEGDHRQSA